VKSLLIRKQLSFFSCHRNSLPEPKNIISAPKRYKSFQHPDATAKVFLETNNKAMNEKFQILKSFPEMTKP
jgi:hypothetical protein